MDKDLIERERKLERVKLDNDIETQKAEIAQKKAIISKMKKEYGPDFSKILNIHPKKDTLQDMYAVSPDLRNLSIPRRIGK